MENTFRGSRRHILELIDSPNYVQKLNTLLKNRAFVTEDDNRVPSGKKQSSEWEIPQFCETYFSDWVDPEKIRGWWLPTQPENRRAKGPTWDLLSTCQMGDRRGLLLVEAKAHEGELSSSGKSFDPTGSEQSQRNHDHIRECLAAVSESLRKAKWDVSIGIESHYQLANRIAWAWKLADSGIPVVLLYLGFVGDSYFADHFRDADHWQRTMGAYMHGILPKYLPGITVASQSGGEFTLLVEALPIPLSTDREIIERKHVSP